MISTLLLAATSMSWAAPDELDFELEGYYRTRAYSFHNLYNNQDGPGKYLAQRLRLQPVFKLQERAKFAFMVDALDDVVWGDNQSLASTALFAGDPSVTNMQGQRQDPAFMVKRAWIEMDVILGQMRVGRQPSHWGMGLLANNGDGFDDYFGENHSGANFDRILFATKPIALYQKLVQGKEPDNIPFFVGYAYDRLVEDPLVQYYGYKCEPDISIDDEGFNPACDPDGKGKHTLDHGYTDDGFQQENRQRDWAFDNADDVTEHVYLAIYRGENVKIAGSASDLTVGLYAINRTQQETKSNVWIIDGYFKLHWKGLYLETEALNISGTSSAIALPGAYDPENTSADPLYKNVNIWGYSARAGYKKHNWSFIVETGYASGDNNVADDEFTGRPLHPDFNVGLLLYDEILAAASAAAWGDGASALWSGGGVYNSRYIYPVFFYEFWQGWSFTAAYVQAWPDRPDGAIIQCNKSDDVSCELYESNVNEIGWEVDFALKAKFHNYLLLSVEGGYAQVSDRIKLANAGLNPDGKFFTLQSRLAYEF